MAFTTPDVLVSRFVLSPDDIVAFISVDVVMVRTRAAVPSSGTLDWSGCDFIISWSTVDHVSPGSDLLSSDYDVVAFITPDVIVVATSIYDIIS